MMKTDSNNPTATLQVAKHRADVGLVYVGTVKSAVRIERMPALNALSGAKRNHLECQQVSTDAFSAVEVRPTRKGAAMPLDLAKDTTRDRSRSLFARSTLGARFVAGLANG